MMHNRIVHIPVMQTSHNSQTNEQTKEWTRTSWENCEEKTRRNSTGNGSWFSLKSLDRSKHEQMSLDLSLHDHEEEDSNLSKDHEEEDSNLSNGQETLEVEFQDRQVLRGKGKKVRRSLSLGDLRWRSIKVMFSQDNKNYINDSDTIAETETLSSQEDREAWDSLARQLERSQESNKSLGIDRDLENEIISTKLTLAAVQTENDHYRKDLQTITEQRDTIQEEYQELKIRYQQAIQEVMALRGHGGSSRSEVTTSPTSAVDTFI